MSYKIQIADDTIDEIQQLFTEGEFNSRWQLIETYHAVGRLINTRLSGNRTDILQALAPLVGRSVRTLWYAVKFHDIYPDLNSLPEGKNVSMNKIITKYLTTSKQDECPHGSDQVEVISFKKCKGCGKHLGKVENEKLV